MIDEVRLTLLLLSALALDICGCTQAIAASQWKYRPMDATEREIVIRSPGFISVGHLGLETYLCPDNGPMKCFRTNVLSFAVPRELADGAASWAEGGVKYTVIGHRRELFLGREIDAFFISAMQEGFENEFVFSRERGLLSITIHRDAVTTQYISIEACGFLAPPTCAP